MKKFLLILPLFISVCLLCGCAHDDDASPSGVSPDAPQVSFVLSLTDATPKTRATWGENTGEDGNEYENRINPDDVQVLLYTTDNKYVANVDILSYYPLNDNGDYQFFGSVTADEGELTAGKEYKLMVFANCGEVTPNQSDPMDQSDLSDLSQLSYNYGVQLIPMWGVITEELTLEKGKQQYLGKIDLLRAMAKVEIKLNDAISGTYTITSATLSKYNTAGYCLPAGYASVNETTELEQETGNNKDTFNPKPDSQSKNLAFSYSSDKKTAWLYIPEYDNSTDPATISLTVSDGTTTGEVTGTLEFKDYENGTATGDAHDIVRNHIYRYTVNVETGELTVQYKALPWNLVTSSIGWKPQPVDSAPQEGPENDENKYYPFNGENWTNFKNGNYYILLPYSGFKKGGTQSLANLFHDLYKKPKNGDVEATLSFVCRPGYNDDHDNHTVLKTGSGAARFFFMLTGPEGATWEAHLTNTEDFSFSQTPGNYFLYAKEDYADEKDHMATHGIARKDKPYIIQINANNDYTEDMVKKEGRTGCFGDEYLTDWGKKNWYGQRVVDTEFYITVRLTDGTEYELTINPSYDNAGGELQNSGKFYFKNRRRYAGTDTRIWIRQLRAQNGWGYDDLAKDIAPSTSAGTGKNDYAWWRVNPYWE